MIRVVSLRKASVAGVCGALVWTAALRGLDLLGLPSFDIVKELGTLAFAPDEPLRWGAVGLVAHGLVGICWALVYAYFFWSRVNLRPALQGLAFSTIPALLALFILHPQLQLMHLRQDVVTVTWETVLPSLSLSQLTGLLIGHAIFGLVVGAIYTHPVGYRADSKPPFPQLPRRPTDKERRSTRQVGSGFIFATGIECSYPTIEKGRWRRDQMASTRHYDRWQADFELALDLGITHVRYGPPLHLIFRGMGSYDWGLIDEPMAYLYEHGPEPIVDLCHFGVPSWLGDFQNPDVPEALAEYAAAFAARYPWVRFYTPVNEMYVCARMSALDGTWNEQLRDEKAFAAAVLHLARASIAMTDAILTVRPDAIFINSESSEFRQPCCPDPEIQRIASFENERRFLPLDLIYGHAISETMRSHLYDHGIREADYAGFLARKLPARTILGLDYYEWNERLIDNEGRDRALGELFGWYVIASHYYERYGLPMMHTETNRLDASDAPRWLWRQWHNVQLLRSTGVPLVGFTWYSLTDQIDWDIGLRGAVGNVDAVGLADLNRDIRTVGLTYKRLIGMHKDQPGYDSCPALARVMA
ncbi:MAG TPA: family 1 glycosylhydrolase [Sphingomicrobium sp.]|nr:family 1 glycosylhydrolase [Sphingomicrobium sp.]